MPSEMTTNAVGRLSQIEVMFGEGGFDFFSGSTVRAIGRRGLINSLKSEMRFVFDQQARIEAIRFKRKQTIQRDCRFAPGTRYLILDQMDFKVRILEDGFVL